MSPKRYTTCSRNTSRTVCFKFLVVGAVAKFKSSNYFLNRPKTIRDFKDKIRADTARMPQDTLREVTHSVRRRVEFCLESGGAHLTDTIFKK
jgi:hypothetical protein